MESRFSGQKKRPMHLDNTVLCSTINITMHLSSSNLNSQRMFLNSADRDENRTNVQPVSVMTIHCLQPFGSRNVCIFENLNLTIVRQKSASIDVTQFFGFCKRMYLSICTSVCTFFCTSVCTSVCTFLYSECTF